MNGSFIWDARGLALTITQAVTKDARTILHSAPSTIPLRTLDASHLATASVAYVSARRRALDVGAFVADRTLMGAVSSTGPNPVRPKTTPDPSEETLP